MDIGRELRVIEVDEPTIESAEIEPLELEEPAKSRPPNPGHTKG